MSLWVLCRINAKRSIPKDIRDKLSKIILKAACEGLSSRPKQCRQVLPFPLPSLLLNHYIINLKLGPKICSLSGHWLSPGTEHQGLPIKIHFLATLANLCHQDLQTHPRRDFPPFLLKVPPAETPAACCLLLPISETAPIPVPTPLSPRVINLICAENLESKCVLS